jgi:predicted RNA-binding Zn-ribbon protein involved in translation (DUF1610 family)
MTFGALTLGRFQSFLLRTENFETLLAANHRKPSSSKPGWISVFTFVFLQSNLPPVDDLRDNLRTDKAPNLRCPKCGGALIKRRAKRGAMAGNAFYGCANYPKCRYTKNA